MPATNIRLAEDHSDGGKSLGEPSIDSQSDTEDDNAERGDGLSSVAESDRLVLQEEEERERLLGIDNGFEKPKGFLNIGSRDGKSARNGPQDPRKQLGRLKKNRKARRTGKRHEKGELLYEMEEGGLRDNISSHSSSSSLELDRLKGEPSRTLRCGKAAHYMCISGAITTLFCALAFGAYFGTSTNKERHDLPHLSNGSSSFGPTTILISLDGFRADFLDRGLTPTLNSFIAQGVSPKYMIPSFPSVTFPNHYTLVTGLYPESHGVVGNSFWDPDFQEEFYYTDPSRSMQPKWWAGGEPLWVTAELQNLKSAIHMWPGSEAHITLEPTFLDKFNADEMLSRKVDRILELLDTPNSGQESQNIERPQFIAAYVPVVDADGHTYGPNSTEIRGTISAVDTMLRDLFIGLDERNLTQIVNIVVVSDHGMASTSTDRLIQLDDLIDLALVEHIDGWPLYGLRPKNPDDLQSLYNTLRAESAQNPNFEVYLRDKDMPERYHFSKNDRIAPLWVIPKTGWAIVHKEDFDVKEAKVSGKTYHPKGLHGYDHEHPLMRAIFVARGPAFPHEPNSMLDNFQNIEVYNIICDSLFIEPKPNNGTLRLPLKPIGLHSDHLQVSEINLNKTFHKPEESASPTNSGAPNSSSSANQSTNHDNTTPNPSSKKPADNFWHYISIKLDAIESWLKNAISHAKNETSKSAD